MVARGSELAVKRVARSTSAWHGEHAAWRGRTYASLMGGWSLSDHGVSVGRAKARELGQWAGVGGARLSELTAHGRASWSAPC